MGVVFALLLENRFSVHSVQVKGANLVCALVLKALQCSPLVGHYGQQVHL